MTNGGTPFIALNSQNSLNSSTLATFLFLHRTGNKFFWSNAKLKRNCFTFFSINGNEDDIEWKCAMGLLVGVWSYWMNIRSLSEMCLSHKRAAGPTRYFVRVQNHTRGKLLIIQTVTLITTWEAPGVFWKVGRFFQFQVIIMIFLAAWTWKLAPLIRFQPKCSNNVRKTFAFLSSTQWNSILVNLCLLWS